MKDMSLTETDYDFSKLKSSMQRYVDNQILPGVSYALLKGRNLIDVSCIGWADKERDVALNLEHIFRVFSNTKLITTCSAMLLFEEGRFKLDDPIEIYIPQLANRRVLNANAASLNDTEPAARSMTIRHLLSHSSGLSLGLLDPGSLMFKTYNERKVRDPNLPLSDMIDKLADLPLSYHPGTSWEYSVATDVIGRLVEILSGQSLDSFMRERILDPLGMQDTVFTLPKEKHHRLVTYYAGADLMDSMKPGLTRNDKAPYPGANLKPFPMLSGGGGMVSTLPDMVALIRSLLPDGETLLKPETIALMSANHLPESIYIRFPQIGDLPGIGYSLCGAITLAPTPFDPPESTGELRWGGFAGTHWWISRNKSLSAILMTQRHMAFWHPFSFEFKNLAYKAVCS